MMNANVRASWVEALRSGAYRQGTDALRQRKDDGIDSFCCLGVLCDLAERAGVVTHYQDEYLHLYGAEANGGSLPDEVIEWAGLDSPDPSIEYDGSMPDLSELNDHYQLSFKRLADLIEERQL